MFDPRVSVLINFKWFTEFGFGTNLKNKKYFCHSSFTMFTNHNSLVLCSVCGLFTSIRRAPLVGQVSILIDPEGAEIDCRHLPPHLTRKAGALCTFVLLLATMLCIVSDWIGVSGSWVKIIILKSVVHVNRGWGWLTIAFDFLQVRLALGSQTHWFVGLSSGGCYL